MKNSTFPALSISLQNICRVVLLFARINTLAYGMLLTAGTNAYAQYWSAVGTGLSNGGVYALESYNGNLYAGGQFWGPPGDKIACWNGSAWASVGTGMSGAITTANDAVLALAVYNGELFAAGLFRIAGGVAVTNIAKWNGSVWSAVGPVGYFNNAVSSLAVYNGELYAGGSFSGYIAKWNGASWSSPGFGLSGSVRDMYSEGAGLYIAGAFVFANGITVNNIAVWDGTSCVGLGGGVSPGGASALFPYNGKIFAGGFFTMAGGVSANYIAGWNGSAWSSAGSGMDLQVYSLKNYNGNLYAGGSFTIAGGTSANAISRWNGTSWSSLTSGTNSTVEALCVFNGDLYVGGWFSNAGGVLNTSRVAKWTTPATPVEYVQFRAQKETDSTVRLSWSASSEMYNDYFEVERSLNRKIFAALGKVKGTGNFNSMQSYSFTDNYPLSGMSYYRLKQVDLNGTFTYSTVAEITIGTEEALICERIYPNPLSGNKLFVSLQTFNAGFVTVKITDMAGRLVYSEISVIEAGRKRIEISAETLNPGIYILEIEQNKNKILQKFVK